VQRSPLTLRRAADGSDRSEWISGHYTDTHSFPAGSAAVRVSFMGRPHSVSLTQTLSSRHLDTLRHSRAGCRTEGS
jgi:hypothetical protein